MDTPTQRHGLGIFFQICSKVKRGRFLKVKGFPDIDWCIDSTLSDKALFWDTSSMVTIRGPPRIAQYRDDSGSTGLILRDYWSMTSQDKLRFANGGHIITEDTDGVIRVYCKKMYLKFGKRKYPLPKLPPLIITAESAVATFCPVCNRFVKLREQLIKLNWYGHVLKYQSIYKQIEGRVK